MRSAAFDKALAAATSADQRIAYFGALLSKEIGTGVEVVGGSAIEVYLTSGEYVSEDIDLVGPKAKIVAALRGWGFRPVEGRSHRSYWFKPGLGLVDIVGARDRWGLRPTTLDTPFGPALLSAVEPLIVRRLSRARRERVGQYYDQALKLARGRDLDWEYLETMAKFENVEGLLTRLRRGASRGRASAARHS